MKTKQNPEREMRVLRGKKKKKKKRKKKKRKKEKTVCVVLMKSPITISNNCVGFLYSQHLYQNNTKLCVSQNWWWVGHTLNFPM